MKTKSNMPGTSKEPRPSMAVERLWTIGHVGTILNTPFEQPRTTHDYKVAMSESQSHAYYCRLL